MRPNLFAYSTGGRIFSDGGEKLHIYDWSAGRLLCGRHLTGSCVDEVTPDWFDNVDGSAVCRQCARKASGMLGVNENSE